MRGGLSGCLLVPTHAKTARPPTAGPVTTRLAGLLARARRLGGAHMQRVIHAYNARLHSHPYSTKAAGTALTYVCSDLTAQTIERRRSECSESAGEAALSAERALKFGAVGGFWVGPLLTYWFQLMDRVVPGRTPRAIAVKMLVDQTVQGPFMIGTMFAWCAVLNGASGAAIVCKLKDELLNTWVNSVYVWAPVQIFQQAVVPLQYRVAVSNVVSYFWDTYLSLQMMPPPAEAKVLAAQDADGAAAAMPAAASTRAAPVLLRRMSTRRPPEEDRRA